MRIDPQIRALREDEVSRRAIQARLERVRKDWLEGPAASLGSEFAAYGEGAALEKCETLSSLFDCPRIAAHLVRTLVDPMMEAVCGNPLGHVPLRHQFSDKLSVIELMKSGRAALTLLTYDELDIEPASASFSGGERNELVLAGAADIAMVELLEERDGRAALELAHRRLVEGELLRCKSGMTTRLVKKVHGRLVLLRLARSEESAIETRQYRLSDGRLLHRASGSREESRREMAMALLGRMGRKDAAPLLAELAMEGSAHIRWQSLRECLALDSGAGFAALGEIAARPSDDLAMPAGALRARLIEAYPQLVEKEESECPA